MLRQSPSLQEGHYRTVQMSIHFEFPKHYAYKLTMSFSSVAPKILHSTLTPTCRKYVSILIELYFFVTISVYIHYFFSYIATSKSHEILFDEQGWFLTWTLKLRISNTTLCRIQNQENVSMIWNQMRQHSTPLLTWCCSIVTYLQFIMI